MSAPSIARLLPFRRVPIGGYRLETDPAVALVDLEPDRRYVPRCGWCGSRYRQIHSSYRRQVRDLSLGAHCLQLR